MRRWSQDRDVPKLRYQPELDPKNKGWHYLWEGAGFVVQVFKTGKRHWMQTGSTKTPVPESFGPFSKSWVMCRT